MLIYVFLELQKCEHDARRNEKALTVNKSVKISNYRLLNFSLFVSLIFFRFWCPAVYRLNLSNSAHKSFFIYSSSSFVFLLEQLQHICRRTKEIMFLPRFVSLFAVCCQLFCAYRQNCQNDIKSNFHEMSRRFENGLDFWSDLPPD